MDFIVANSGIVVKIILGISGGILLFFIIKHSAKILQFLKEVRSELVKVSWPTRQEVVTSTLVILVLTAFLTVYVGIIELGLSKILTLFLK